MKNKRHTQKLFSVSFFLILSTLTFILTQVSNKLMVFALIWDEFVFEIEWNVMRCKYLSYMKVAGKDSAFENIAFKIASQTTDYFSHSWKIVISLSWNMSRYHVT